MLEAVHKVLANNDKELRSVIRLVRESEIEKEQLLLALSVIQASNKTLEVVTGTLVKSEMKWSVPDEPKVNYADLAVTEDDNPEIEDRDRLRRREEEYSNFFK